VSHSQNKLYFTYVEGPVFSTGRKAPAPPETREKAKANQ
jgi:hypothetical protein